MNLRRNVVWNIAETIVTVLTLFCVYKLIMVKLNIVSLGVWSLVLAATSMARIADVGLASGLVRYVARANSLETSSFSALMYVETALSANCIFYVCLGALVYWPAWYALGWGVHAAQLLEARKLLPYAIASFILLNISAVISSSLVGYHRSDIKSKITIIASAFQLGGAWLSITSFGLVGLALAQIFQYLVVSIVGWCAILNVDETVSGLRAPFRLNVAAFREMAIFGIRLQVLSLANFVYEPLTKFAISAMAGPAALGFFEMTYRMVIQARAVILSPSQNLTPLFASLSDHDSDRRKTLYNSATASLALGALIGCTVVVLGSPVASLAFLDRVDGSFVAASAILCAGWLFNIVAVPSYLMGIAAGKIKWNIIGASSSAVLSPLLCYFIGTAAGTIGLIFASAFAIGLGGIIVLIMNSKLFDVQTPVSTIETYRRLFSVMLFR